MTKKVAMFDNVSKAMYFISEELRIIKWCVPLGEIPNAPSKFPKASFNRPVLPDLPRQAAAASVFFGSLKSVSNKTSEMKSKPIIHKLKLKSSYQRKDPLSSTPVGCVLWYQTAPLKAETDSWCYCSPQTKAPNLEKDYYN